MTIETNVRNDAVDCDFQAVTMLQMKFDGELVPTAPHPDDRMECSDDTCNRRGDAFIDCTGNAHRDEDACHEGNVEFVTETLDARAKSACDYATHEDYGDGCSFLVKDLVVEWKARVKEWIIDDGVDTDWDDYPELLAWVTETIWQKIYDFGNWDAVYESSDYAAYYGDGCCLVSWEIGELEEQISLSEHPGLAELHNRGELEALLEEYNGELSISHNDRYDKELGRRVPAGYVSEGKYPDIMGYVNPGGQWHYVVSEENMADALEEALREYAEWEG